MKTFALTIYTAAIAQVESRSVTFQNQVETLSGTLHLPEGHEAAAPLPVVDVTGAWTSVEEQMPATYAREMA